MSPCTRCCVFTYRLVWQFITHEPRSYGIDLFNIAYAEARLYIPYQKFVKGQFMQAHVEHSTAQSSLSSSALDIASLCQYVTYTEKYHVHACCVNSFKLKANPLKSKITNSAFLARWMHALTLAALLHDILISQFRMY